MCKEGMQYIGIDKGPVIFCCTHNSTILNIISKIAFDKHVRIFHYIDPDDIMTIPYDIAVVNRNMLGRNGWTNYTSWLREINKTEETLFVFLDKKPYAEDTDLFQIKSFQQDFNSDYKSLFDFLNSALQRIVKEKCLCNSK